MYTQKGKKIKASTIERRLRESVADLNKSEWGKSEYRKYRDLREWDYEMAAQALQCLNDALMDNRSVFAVCDKEPRNLDSGSHHYSIHFVTKDGHVNVFWAGPLMEYLGASKNKVESGMRYFTFKSGAIGMSRLLASTDGVFSFLRKCGGCYSQIQSI